jgi:NADH-quinone oxidoreductase subunit A
MSGLLGVVILAAFVTGFGIFLVWGSGLLGPKRTPTAAKTMPYECGVQSQEAKDTKISIKFYLTAILFILFDIEIIFMYPWAVTFMDSVKAGEGLYMLGVMGVFIFLFVVGLVWEVKSKALDWKN